MPAVSDHPGMVPTPAADPGPGRPPAPGPSAGLDQRPAVTGEMPAVPRDMQGMWGFDAVLIDPATDDLPGVDRGRAPTRISDGSVADHSSTSASDWMSGVEVPQMLVTQVITPGDLEMSRRDRVAGAVQRALGLVLLTLLVAAVVLVIAGSVTGLGARLN